MLINSVECVDDYDAAGADADYDEQTGPVFYLWLLKVPANGRSRYLLNTFSRWLRPCSKIDRKRVLTTAVDMDSHNITWRLIIDASNWMIHQRI